MNLGQVNMTENSLETINTIILLIFVLLNSSVWFFEGIRREINAKVNEHWSWLFNDSKASSKD